MRAWIYALGLVLAGCASPGQVTTHTLAAADAATSLAVGERIVEDVTTFSGSEGMDPTINLTLRHADGRSMSFQQANHAPYDLMAQTAGGPLAQIMGLPGDQESTLYHANSADDRGAPFFCAPDGPRAIGMSRGPDGVLLLVGLKQAIQFETRPDGVTEALPFSPDQVCARLRFRRH